MRRGEFRGIRRFNSRLREEATAAEPCGGIRLPVSTHASVRRRRASLTTNGNALGVSTHASVRRRLAILEGLALRR